MSDDFSSFAPDLWASLETIVRASAYDARVVLLEQDQAATGVYLIQSGKVRLWSPQDKSRLLRKDLGAGTMRGLGETIAQGTPKLSARTLVPTKIGLVPGQSLMNLLRDRRDICLQVVRVLSEDLRVLYHRFQELKAQPSEVPPLARESQSVLRAMAESGE